MLIRNNGLNIAPETQNINIAFAMSLQNFIRFTTNDFRSFLGMFNTEKVYKC